MSNKTLEELLEVPMNCINCFKEISEREAHNGAPLFEGKVCTLCNEFVIIDRMNKIKKGH